MRPSKLHALGDTPVPATLADDLSCIAGLPASAIQAFWEALGPSLKEPLPPEIEGTLDRFSRDHGAPPAELSRAIRGARFLVREAVKRGVGASELEADLRALLPSDEAIVRLLLAGYGKARAVLMDASLGRALLDHGRVVDTIAWRADDVSATHRGEVVGGRVAVVTMRLSTPAGAEELVTFQLTQKHSRTLKELAAALERAGHN